MHLTLQRMAGRHEPIDTEDACADARKPLCLLVLVEVVLLMQRFIGYCRFNLVSNGVFNN